MVAHGPCLGLYTNLFFLPQSRFDISLFLMLYFPNLTYPSTFFVSDLLCHLVPAGGDLRVELQECDPRLENKTGGERGCAGDPLDKIVVCSPRRCLVVTISLCF